MSAKQDISKFFAKISKAIKEAVEPRALAPLAKFAIDLIVKRTRLGYGVKEDLGQKEKLKPLTRAYIEQRSKSRLSAYTTASRSNLTRTGQMLESMRILEIKEGSVTIGMSGRRTDGHTNDQIAQFNAERGRPFNHLSQLEFQQVLREYRRTFGDLVSKRGLIS